MSSSSDNVELIKETYDLPGSISKIVTLVADILRMGKVQSLVLRKGRPISVERYGLPGSPLQDRSDMSPWAAVRAAPMVEIPPASPALSVFAMLARLGKEGLRLGYFLTAENVSVLRQWADVPVDSRFLSVPLVTDDAVPVDTLIAVGVPTETSELYESVLSVKTTMLVEDLDDSLVRDGIDGWPDPSSGGFPAEEARDADSEPSGGGEGPPASD